jgi:hypothetical protein
MRSGSKFGPKHSALGHGLEQVPNHNHPNPLVELELQRELSQVRYGFDPISASALMCLPSIFQYFSLSPYFYFPCVVLFLSYFQGIKDQQDRQAALGIVTNPKVLRLVRQDLPGWIIDSEMYRLDWLNATLQKMWPFISKGVGDLMKDKMNKFLTRKKPSYFKTLEITSLTIGSQLPIFTGIRFLPNEDSVVRFDLELKWKGDPSIMFEVGAGPIGTKIELTKLNFSTTLRIELLGMKYELPGFEVVSVTCLKDPNVDFSLRLAQFDVTFGVGSKYSLLGLMRGTIQQLIRNHAVFPNKVFLRPTPETKIDQYNILQPIGLCILDIQSGKNLKKVNFLNGSDPYVEVRTMDQMFKTSIKYATVNPSWEHEEPSNHIFEILIYDLVTQKISLEVFDDDVTHMDRLLGSVEISLEDIAEEPGVEQTNQYTLTNTDTGTLQISLTFMSLQTKEEGDGGGGGGGGKNHKQHNLQRMYSQNMILNREEEFAYLASMIDDEDENSPTSFLAKEVNPIFIKGPNSQLHDNSLLFSQPKKHHHHRKHDEQGNQKKTISYEETIATLFGSMDELDDHNYNNRKSFSSEKGDFGAPQASDNLIRDDVSVASSTASSASSRQFSRSINHHPSRHLTSSFDNAVTGVLTISFIRVFKLGEGLKAAGFNFNPFKTPKVRCYCSFTVGNTTHKTAIHKNNINFSTDTNNASFTDSFSFFVKSKEEKLLVKVIDKRSSLSGGDKVLGQVQVSLEKCRKQIGKPVEDKYPLMLPHGLGNEESLMKVNFAMAWANVAQ